MKTIFKEFKEETKEEKRKRKLQNVNIYNITGLARLIKKYYLTLTNVQKDKVISTIIDKHKALNDYIVSLEINNHKLKKEIKELKIGG